MRARFLALAVCSLSLAALWGLWVLVESDHLERLPSEVPSTVEGGIAVATEIARASPRASFAALVCGILLIFDAVALFHRDPMRRGQVRQPADNPLGFATLRVRRYLLIPIVVGWWVAYGNVTGERPPGDVKVAFIVAAVLARRGDNHTYFHMFKMAAELLQSFSEGLTGQHSQPSRSGRDR